MKNLVFAFALLCSPSLVAQFEFNSTNSSGIQSVFEIQASINTASGYASFAIGEGTEASQDGSTAMGGFTIASGGYSTAMGYQTTASGAVSTAMGHYTTASGYASTAIGYYTVAQDFGTTSLGFFNKINETPNPYSLSLQNTAFVIGNGTNENRSNAFKVLFDGTTTIAGYVTAPAFIGDGSQLTNLPLSFNENGSGIQSSTSTASGGVSTAMGAETNASGVASTASGQGTTASGNYSTAMGLSTAASGIGSTAMGSGTTASGVLSTAMGAETNASGVASTALGEFTQASGDSSTSLGQSTTASGNYSTAMGSGTQASGAFSTAMGYLTTSSGHFSTASGGDTTAQDYGTTAIGLFNENKETPNPFEFSYQNTAFVIGNGGFDSNGNYDGHLSNALEVLFDGTTTIAGDLNINSDARLKANIISLGATLSKLLQIDGKTYTMKKDANHKKKIGLLAQDIEKVFPELVTETNDIKSVNYQGLVPVLINAMKEQQDEIEQLKKKQQQEIDELKAMVKALAKG